MNGPVSRRRQITILLNAYRHTQLRIERWEAEAVDDADRAAVHDWTEWNLRRLKEAERLITGFGERREKPA